MNTAVHDQGPQSVTLLYRLLSFMQKKSIECMVVPPLPKRSLFSAEGSQEFETPIRISSFKSEAQRPGFLNVRMLLWLTNGMSRKSAVF